MVKGVLYFARRRAEMFGLESAAAQLEGSKAFTKCVTP